MFQSCDVGYGGVGAGAGGAAPLTPQQCKSLTQYTSEVNL